MPGVRKGSLPGREVWQAARSAPTVCAERWRPTPPAWDAAGIRDDRARNRGGSGARAVRRCRPWTAPKLRTRTRRAAAPWRRSRRYGRARNRGGTRARGCRRRPSRCVPYRTAVRPGRAVSGRSSPTRSRRGRRYGVGWPRVRNRAGAVRHRARCRCPDRARREAPRSSGGTLRPGRCRGSGPRPGAGAERCRARGFPGSGSRGAGCPGGRMRHPRPASGRSPRRSSRVSEVGLRRTASGTARRSVRRTPVPGSCHRTRGTPWRRRPVDRRHLAPVERSHRTPAPPHRHRLPASRTLRTPAGPAPRWPVGRARRTPASRSRRSPAHPAPRNRARPHRPSAAEPAGAVSSGVGESRRGVLPYSCAPRFLMSGPFGRARALAGVAGVEDGRPGTHTRTGGPASRRRGDGGRTALRACA